MDVEADAIIRALFVRNPDAAYRVTMLAMSLLANSEPQRPQNLPRHRGWFSTLFDKRSGASHAPSERREPVIS
jgi:hypothetical protein